MTTTDETTQEQPQLHTAVLRWKDDGQVPFLTTDGRGVPIVVLPLAGHFTMQDGRRVGSVALDMEGLEQVGAAMANAVRPALDEAMNGTRTDTDEHLTDEDRAYLARLRPDAEAFRGLPGDAWCLVADTIAQLRAHQSRTADTDEETQPDATDH